MAPNSTREYEDDSLPVNDTNTVDNETHGSEEDYLRYLFNKLSSWQLEQILNVNDKDGQMCLINAWTYPLPAGVIHCNVSWDEFTCWPPTPANTTVSMPCPIPCPTMETPFTEKFCMSNGQWETGNWTNYTGCFHHALDCKTMNVNNSTEPGDITLSVIMRDIFFYGSIVSLVLLTLSLIIFNSFKSLQCSRISIHKNLVVSFIIRYLIVCTLFEPFVSNSERSYRDVSWLCKLIVAVHYYAMIANIFWMFVEGLFLYNRIAVSVFNAELPMAIFYTIGWGLPLVFIIAFSLCMHYLHDQVCWDYNADTPYAWIVFAPIIAALAVNAFFLIMIIIILVTKLTANNSFETNQVRKAVKATLVLFPLLGLTNLLFVSTTGGNVNFKMAYHIINAILQVSQGVFVSVIYCFLNGEVQTAIRKKWERFRLSKLGVRGRRRSSRTSSFFMSQSENSNSQHKNSATLKNFVTMPENNETTR